MDASDIDLAIGVAAKNEPKREKPLFATVFAADLEDLADKKYHHSNMSMENIFDRMRMVPQVPAVMPQISEADDEELKKREVSYYRVGVLPKLFLFHF